MQIQVNPETREKAMPVLDEMGITMSELFNMLLSEIAMRHKIPFDVDKYSTIMPSPEEDYHTFDTWREAKEWLNA